MQWFYADGNQQAGPVGEEQLRQLATDGRISDVTLVWHEGMADWRPYGEVVLARARPGDADGEGACGECGRRLPLEQLIELDGVRICATCKPLAVQKLCEGVSLARTLRYGGFWIRFAAKFVDGIIVWVANMAVAMAGGVAMGAMLGGGGEGETSTVYSLVTMVVNMLLQVTVGAIYATWFIGRFGATPGKMMLGLRVVRADGGRVTYLRALGRHFAETLSSIILMIGYLMAAFDEEKRTLHDRICDTRVVLR